jgi:hypothetical protein
MTQAEMPRPNSSEAQPQRLYEHEGPLQQVARVAFKTTYGEIMSEERYPRDRPAPEWDETPFAEENDRNRAAVVAHNNALQAKIKRGETIKPSDWHRTFAPKGIIYTYRTPDDPSSGNSQSRI